MGLLTYSAKQIHAELLAKNILLLQNIIEEQKKEYKQVPACISVELYKLNSLGLSNTKNAKVLEKRVLSVKSENEEIRKYNDAIDFNKERIEFINETRKVFCDNVLIVSFDDFEHIIKKYNLVCGLLEQYTGVIPKENIEEFEKAREIIYNDNNKEYRKKYIKPLQLIKDYKDYLVDRFPFCYEVDDRKEKEYDVIEEFGNDLYRLLEYRLLDLRNQILFYHIIGKNEDKTSISIGQLSEPTDFFIAAPKKDMDFSESLLEKLIPKPKDPFICSYTKYGIIVHTKWGEEADDEVLKKYYRQIKALEK